MNNNKLFLTLDNCCPIVDYFTLYSWKTCLISHRHFKFCKQNTAHVLHENLLYKTSTRHRTNSKQSRIVTIDSCFAIIVAYQYGVTTRESSVEKYPHTLILALTRGGSRNFWLGGPNFGSQRTVQPFCAKLLFLHTPFHQSLRRQRWPWVSQSVNFSGGF